MLTFSFGLVFFTTGIAYLSAYSYSYTLNSFSVDMMAGLFITAGILISALSTVRVFFKVARIQYYLILALAITVLVFSILFFILGIIGLSLDHSTSALVDLKRTIQRYNNNDKRNSYTRKIDWLQIRFNCCGIFGYQDWRSTFNNKNTYLPINHLNKHSNYQQGLPYIDGMIILINA